MHLLRTVQSRLRSIERDLADAYVDIAIQLRVKETGELGPIHGGRWHKYQCRYLDPEEVEAQIADSDSELEASQKALRIHIHDAHQKQFNFAENSKDQLIVVTSGRRGGKTRGSALKSCLNLVDKPGVCGQTVCPSFPKTRIMWGYALKQIPHWWIQHVHNTNRTIQLHNGAVWQFLSAYKPDSLVGEGLGWLNFDESQSIGDHAIDLAMPALSDGGTSFQVWHTGTKRLGTFKTRCEKYRKEGAKFYSFVSFDNPFISTGKESAFDLASRTMDPARYRREILDEWASEEGMVYYQFSRETHVKKWASELRNNRAEDITRTFLSDEISCPSDYLIGVDYGHNRHWAVVYKIARIGRRICPFAVDEVALYRDASIEDLGAALTARGYGNSAVVDDAAGQYSKGGASASTRLENLGFEVYHPRRNPPVVTRTNAMNALMKTADGTVRYYIDPKCEETIRCFESQEMTNGRPDKESGFDHMPDAAGYPIAYLFPAEINFEQLAA